MSYFKCVLCNKIFTDEELQDVVRLTKSRSGKIVKFKNGEIRDIHHLSPGTHRRWHSKYGVSNYPGCFFCELEQQKKEMEKIEHEDKQNPRKEETVPPAVGETQDNYRPRGSDPMEDVPPAETASNEPAKPSIRIRNNELRI